MSRITFLSIGVCFLLHTALAQEVILKNELVPKKRLLQRRVLSYPPLREADILWEKRIWQVIDTREKMNQVFNAPEQSLFQIIVDAAADGSITTYADEKFTIPLDQAQLKQTFFQSDTFEIVHPETYEITFQILSNSISAEEIVRYRIKEVWFFDARSSTMRVRILGIAPIRSVYRQDGQLQYETPLFWIYYPDCRELLAQHLIPNDKNDNAVLSWENLLEMRMFTSYIYKEANVKDEYLQDYLSGGNLLVESNHIKQEILNFEQDLWSY